LAVGADGFVYLTIGDFECDGTKKGPMYPQNADNEYGKTVQIDPNDWSVTRLSIGHRNPQGIATDDQGRVWLVEHGPTGGDELNLIRQGLNYGWPLVTLGVEGHDPFDDDKRWPLSSRQGRHDNYESPVFAWIPSIGVSNVKQIHDIHPRWDGDLLVSSLQENSLHRLRVVGDHVISEERIPIGARIRYVDIGKGVIYLLLDDGRFATLRPRLTPTLSAEKNKTPTPASDASAAASQVGILETAGCIECHSNVNAPRLAAIVGKPIAAQPGVDYSAALLNKHAVWTVDNLRAFLKDTQGFAPGTQMPTPALSEAEIDDVIAQLKGDPTGSPAAASAP
jgi:cytochrome c2